MAAAGGSGQLNLYESPSPSGGSSRNLDCFHILEQIGEGTYGQVYKAKEKETGEIVALKKIRMDNEREGFPITAIREIKILKKLHHDNVIHLKEIVTSPGRDENDRERPDGNKYKGSIYMVFEYMDHDLTGLADRPGLRFTIPQIKCYLKQLLTGLHYCHVNQVLHRDIKGANLLIDNEGILKLADFGLARTFSNDHNGNLTNRVITLWYRPLELLIGVTKYGPAIDMWSVGCIFAELLHGKPIFQGKNEASVSDFSGKATHITLIYVSIGSTLKLHEVGMIPGRKRELDQLKKIIELCGTPEEANWPGFSKIPWNINFKPSGPIKRRFRDNFRHFDRHALDLLDKMLTLDPSQRISAKDALDAEYFWTDPLPCDPKSLPKYESSHEFQTKKRRQQQRENEELAKRQKLQNPQLHARPPPTQHTRQQAHPPHWPGSNHPTSTSQPPAIGGLGHHHYAKAPPTGATNRYPPSGKPGGYNPNHGGGQYGGGPYPPQGRAPPYAGSGAPPTGSRGPINGGHKVGPANYPQGGQYGGSISGAGRGSSNQAGGNRNQPYGWQP